MMDVQTAPPTYAAAGYPAPPTGNPPVLGQQIPGMTGGLPAQSGLPVTANPMARQLQSYGRGDDSMLIHMTPEEVNSLQGLAMAHGGSLTINPDTGLPEAGWLGKLLPTILGAALAATGVGAPLAAGIVGAGQFARTGSLKKGLMAGLGAFGGAGMAGMAGVGGKISSNAFGALSDKAGMFGANMGLGAAANPVATYLNSPELAQQFATKFGTQTAGAASPAGSFGASMEKVINAPELVAQRGADIASSAMAKAPTIAPRAVAAGPMAQVGGGAQFTGGLGSRFGQAVRAGLPAGTPGMISKMAPMMAGMGALNNISAASQPNMKQYNPDDEEGYKFNYEGPYRTIPRKVDPRVQGEGEIQFFDEVNPIGFLTAKGERRGYAEGGEAKEDENKSGGLGATAQTQGMRLADFDPKYVSDGFNRNAALASFNSQFGGMRKELGEDKLRAAGVTPRFVSTLQSDLRKLQMDNTSTPEQHAAAYSNAMATLNSKLAPPPPPPPSSTTLTPPGTTPPEKIISTDTLKTTIVPDKGEVTPGTGTGATLTPPGGKPVEDKISVDTLNTTIKPDMGEVIPGTGTGATLGPKGDLPPEKTISVNTLGTTITPTMGGVTPGTGTNATLGPRTLSEGATQSGAGLEVLKDTYTPKFTQRDNFTTTKRDPYTMGSELAALQQTATDRYQTSPGAITASRTYVGGSPSERIRAAAQARAAAAAAAQTNPAAAPVASTNAAGTPSFVDAYNELDFIGTSGNPANNPNYIPPNSGNNSGAYTGMYNGQANQNAGTVMDTGNVGGEMNYGFVNPASVAPAAAVRQNYNGVNPASLIGTDDFWNALAERYGGSGGTRSSTFAEGQNEREYARGGPINMRDGAFVVDARTVSELGNGSSNAGMELLARLGGRPLHGPGDGVSDSIPARIGGRQEARVARDEVIMPPEAVRRIGKGSEARGTKKLYALMNKAHKARKKAKRGQDTKVAKGLGALA